MYIIVPDSFFEQPASAMDRISTDTMITDNLFFMFFDILSMQNLIFGLNNNGTILTWQGVFFNLLGEFSLKTHEYNTIYIY